MKNKIIIVLITISVILLSTFLFVFYSSHHPKIMLGVGGGHGIEHFALVWSTNLNIPVSKEIEENIVEYHNWNDAIITELMEETHEPRDIKVSGEVIDGVTILRYEGYYTTEDGQRKVYFEEKEFNFVLVPDEELPK